MAFTYCYNEAGTASDAYRCRIKVGYDPTSTGVSQTVTLQLELCRTGAVKRWQHTWGIAYVVDGGNVHTFWGNLPDDNAEAGTVARGYLNMAAGRWYAWGPPVSVAVNNDGASHMFGLSFTCIASQPGEGAVNLWLSFPAYVAPAPPPSTPSAVIPQVPQNVSAVFDAKTRVLKYNIGVTQGASYFTLWSNWINNKGEATKSGWVHNHISYADVPNLTETLPDNIVKVTYEVKVYSVTGNEQTTGHLEVDIPSDPKVYVKINGEWKKAIPYVKVNGEWKKAVSYVKINGEWKKTLT